MSAAARTRTRYLSWTEQVGLPVEEAADELGLLDDGEAPDEDDGLVSVVLQALLLLPLLLLFTILLLLLLRMWVLLLGLEEELVTEEEVVEPVWLPLWGLVYLNFKMVKASKNPPYEYPKYLPVFLQSTFYICIINFIYSF